MIDRRPAVQFEDRVKEGIQGEISHASGSEVGGILLGHRRAESIVVQDFEPVPSEIRVGRSYLLTEAGQRALAESVEWFRGLPANEASSGLSVLGFYRSQARREGSWHERDEGLMRRFFPESGSVFALLRPNSSQSFDAEFFFLQDGTLRPPRPVLAVTPPLQVAAAPPAATRPRRPLAGETTDVSPDRSWWWVAALVALTVVGAVLGYRSAAPASSAPPDTQKPPISQTQPPSAAVPKPSPVPERSAVSPAPVAAALIPPAAPPTSLSAVPAVMDRGIQAAIEGWQHALLSGDPDLLAACYAPRLERYFDRQNSTSALVRETALRSFQQYGKPAILRISGLTILPIAPDRAIATFRKHWQTSGPDIFAGEEEERLAFVRLGDGPSWKIVSEEETRVYWSQRPRGKTAAK